MTEKLFKTIETKTNHTFLKVADHPSGNLIICPFNSRTFPKHDFWIDQNERRWYYKGNGDIWYVKLPKDREVYFADLSHRITLTITIGKFKLQLKGIVRSVFRQNVVVTGQTGSYNCAMSELSITNYRVTE